MDTSLEPGSVKIVQEHSSLVDTKGGTTPGTPVQPKAVQLILLYFCEAYNLDFFFQIVSLTVYKC